MGISVLGAGAFGTALAIALARESGGVTLVGRSEVMTALGRDGQNRRYLPGVELPKTLALDTVVPTGTEIVLLCIPTQKLGAALRERANELAGRMLVACCKGVDLSSGLGPTETIGRALPGATAAILSGPSFAVDIAKGLPTALTIAARDELALAALQGRISTASLRLYRSTDVTGVELGGALKNVVAIAAGVTIGAGLGESARAALMTRGYAEMSRFALEAGARAETLAGLSGLGDLVLTCTSEKSRNFRFGLALGGGRDFDATTTVEGVATARSVASLSATRGIELPVTAMVAALCAGAIDIAQAVQALMARPLKEE